MKTMPPKESESLEFLKIGEMVSQGLHDGLEPLYPLEEVEEDPVWAEEWAKENPYIKAAQEPVTFTAEAQIRPEAAKAFTALGEACKQAAETIGKHIREAANCVSIWAREVPTAVGGIEQFLQAVRARAALNEAPSKVRHLAKHGKKHRTRKKNINRAMREYQRRKK
jgi:hypothetical protein